MADLLAAASLLLTVVTVLYSLWYSEIATASKREIKDQAANRMSDFKECRGVLLWKAIPLFVVTVALVAINLPDAYQIVTDAFKEAGKSPPATYSAIRTTFVAVVIILAFVAGHIFFATKSLACQVWKLDPARGNT